MDWGGGGLGSWYLELEPREPWRPFPDCMFPLPSLFTLPLPNLARLARPDPRLISIFTSSRDTLFALSRLVCPPVARQSPSPANYTLPPRRPLSPDVVDDSIIPSTRAFNWLVDWHSLARSRPDCLSRCRLDSLGGYGYGYGYGRLRETATGIVLLSPIDSLIHTHLRPHPLPRGNRLHPWSTCSLPLSSSAFWSA